MELTSAAAQEAQAYLHAHIPLSETMGVRVVSLDVVAGGDGVRLSAPLAPNVNHRNTVFGGSIASVATLACWTLVWAGLREAQISARIVIARGATDYAAPLSGDFEAVCLPPVPADWDKFLHALRRKKRARITLSATLANAGGKGPIGATFTGDFVALLPSENDKQAPTKTYHLDEILATVTDENRHPQMDWGQPVGKEVW